MNLEDILDGSRVFVDANIIIYALDRKSSSCRNLLVRCKDRIIEGVISSATLAEVSHRRMVEEARAIGLTGSNPARALSRHPEIIQQLRLYAEEMRDLLAGDLNIETIRSDDFHVALELQRQHGLLTNDSLNLAVSKRLGIPGIASADNCFDMVPGLMTYKPRDIIAQSLNS